MEQPNKSQPPKKNQPEKKVDKKKEDEKKKQAEKPEPPKPLTAEELQQLLIADLRNNAALLEKSVQTDDNRFTARVLRSLSSLRRRLNARALNTVITEMLSSEEAGISKTRQFLLERLSKIQEPAPMEVDKSAQAATKTDSDVSMSERPTTTTATTPATTTPAPAPIVVVQQKKRYDLPEVEVYLHLLVLIFLLDKKQNQEAVIVANTLNERLQGWNRRTLHPLSAKAYFYYARSYELTLRSEEIRNGLLALYRTACLKHNDEGAAVLLNLLLRNYLEYNLYDQAHKLISKTTLREDSTSTNQYARYLYYQGAIKAIQLDYTEAFRCLLTAVRKAPQSTARGFRLAVYKLLTIVQLLMGEIPERSIFRTQGLKHLLIPYFQLTQTVRIGDLGAFHEVVNKYCDQFKADKTYTLIQRLRHNVIKAGLRKINTSYSKISFADICKKLHLDSTEDAQFIVAKTIRDGVIDATINYEGQFVQSKETSDVYATEEPQIAFNRRIDFCLKIHNDAVKAMRFPENQKVAVETDKEIRKRESEIAKNFEDEEDEF